MMTLANKHVLIIGGSSGMGLGLAERALRDGARVTIAGRSSEKLATANDSLGNRAETLTFDAGDPAGAEAAYAGIGSVDHVVTTAAALTYAPVTEIPLEAITQMLTSKFWGPLLAARFLAPRIAAGGSLTFFSGLAAYRPGPGTAVVAAVNAGLEGLTKALAVELAPIRVNVLSPGVVETPGWDFMPEADRQAFFEEQSRILPTRYVGTPADVAEAAATLMTNPYITGTVLHVDGGGRLA